MAPRRGQQRKTAERKAARDAERALAEAQERGEYLPPQREECHQRGWVTSLDDGDTVRIDHRFWRQNGRLVDFIILLQVPAWDGWATVVQVDCCHGFCHLHPIEGDSISATQKPIARLDNIDDVERAFSLAIAKIESYGRTIRDMRGER